MKIIFDTTLAGEVLKAFGKSPKKCTFCGDVITPKSFGGVVKEGFLCKNIICLIKFAEAIQSR